LSNVALDPIPQWPQRPEPSSSRAGSSATEPSPSRFDALLANTSSDARPAPSEQYDRSRPPDRRDDTRAADDRAAAQSRAQDARAADRQQAADDRSAARAADDAQAQRDSNKAAAAKHQPATGAPDPTQAKAKASPADATQAQGKSQGSPAEQSSNATQATATDTPAQPVDPAAAAAAAAQAKAAAAAAVIGDTGTATAVKKSDKTTEGDKETSTAATTTPDPNAVGAQVAAIVVPVNPLATIVPSAGAAAGKTADGIAAVDVNLTPADAARKPGAATQAAAAQAAAGTAPGQAAAAAAGADPKAAGAAQQESFKALVEAAAGKTPAGADAKTEQTGKPKPAEQGKTARTNPANPSATDAAQPAGTDVPVVKAGAATPHLALSQSAEHSGPAGRPAASEVGTDAITATAPANAQAGGNAPILPLNLAQPIALPLSTMFQVAAPKAGAAVDAAVPVAGLAVEIVSRAQEGGKRFDIRLDPPELGRVDVRLNVDDNGKVTSHLVVERSETLDLLRRDQPQLERALQQAGLNTDGGLQFSLRDQSSANRDQTPRDNSANTSQLIVPDDEAAAADAARRGYGRLLGRAGGVDIRI
jgi:chemotaxis protein MotD